MAEDGKEDIVSELEKQMAKLEGVQTINLRTHC